MLKLFISQPMNGKTEDYIKKERNHLIKAAEEALGEKFEVIDSIINDAPEDANSIWYLGESIKLMSKADVVIFSKDWILFRGCRIEKKVANEYDITVIES